MSVLVLAGCGEGSAEETYALDPTAGCLSSRGAGVFTTNDDTESFGELGTKSGLQFAAGEENTALALDLGDVRATVVFASSPVEAEQVAARHVELVERVGDVDVNDLVVRRGNAVVLWSKAPEDGSVRLVDECLTEGAAP